MAKLKIEKNVQITLIIVGAVILLSIGAALYFNSNSADNTFQVNGQATSKVSPDLITVFFNVQAKGATYKEANDANSAIVTKLTNNLVALGFSESDLKTQSINIYPEYDYSKGQKLIDYIATTSLEIEIPIAQKSKIGSVVDAGVNAGAGINSINFDLSPALKQTAKAQAIKDASDDARVKAEALASGFNKKLGRLVSVSLDNFNYYPGPIYASADSSGGGAVGAEQAKAAVASITPSDQDVSASVTAIYKLV
jgi:uncharacterized protein YggE